MDFQSVAHFCAYNYNSCFLFVIQMYTSLLQYTACICIILVWKKNDYKRNIKWRIFAIKLIAISGSSTVELSCYFQILWTEMKYFFTPFDIIKWEENNWIKSTKKYSTNIWFVFPIRLIYVYRLNLSIWIIATKKKTKKNHVLANFS